MLRRLLTIIILTLAVFHIQGQNTLGTLKNDLGTYDGYTLFSPNFSTETYLIDNCGRVVHQWTSTYRPGVSVYLLENGNLLRTGGRDEAVILVGAKGGQIELFDWDGNLIWEYTYLSDQVSQHHDVFPLPNGNILMLAVSLMTQAEAVQAGRDPSKLVGNLYNEQILELEPVGANQANIVWEWNVKDHFIQDFDATKDNFGVVKDNSELLDINFGITSGGLANWLHVNSINYNASLDQIILSAKNMSEIYIIDHSTNTAEAASHTGGTYGRGGDFLYRWGNPEAYDHGTSSDKMLYGQHYPHWIPDGLNDGGKIMIYNNGPGRDFSSLDIIVPEESAPGVYNFDQTNGFLPSVAEWSYVDPTDPESFYSPILSSGQRLPNGNTLICEGSSGHFFEIDEEENIVWEYVNPENADGIAAQGDTPPQNFVFRAERFGTDYSAFIGRDLSPGDPIELNFNIDTICDEVGPQVTARSPLNMATEVAINTTKLQLTFDEPIQHVAGEITLKRSSDNTVVEAISSGISIIEDNILEITLTASLEYLTAYYIEIPQEVITDLRGNAFEGYSDANGWSFTTVEIVLGISSNSFAVDNIKVFPNPTREAFNIDLGAIQKVAKLKVIDVGGRSIIESVYYDQDQINVQFPENVQSGIYFLTVQLEEGVFTTQVSLQK